MPVATHNQRGLGTLHLGLPENCDIDVDAAELLEIVEESMSSEIYELMKRSDEGAVVEKAARRPRLAEDCVREAIRGALERFGGLGDDAFVSSRQENLETIQQHSVVAERFGRFGELRRGRRASHDDARVAQRSRIDVGAVDPEVVERRAARVAHAQALDERRVASAGQTVGQHRRTVRGGLGALRPAAPAPRAQAARRGRPPCRGARRPVSRISRGAGTLTVSASAALAAPSSKASQPSPSGASSAPPLNTVRFDSAAPSRYATSASIAPHARAPIGPADPPSPSTMRPPSTASAALNAPPSSSITNDVSAKSTPSRRACSAMHSAALATLSAVPRSMRFHLR